MPHSGKGRAVRCGSLPFQDGEFDAAWRIFVLEHIPNPEQALREIGRVLKPGGLLYRSPAWHCSDLAPNGCPVHPCEAPLSKTLSIGRPDGRPNDAGAPRRRAANSSIAAICSYVT